MKMLVQILILSFTSYLFAAREETPENIVKLSVDSLKENYLAISFEILPGWHVYWKNPGDAGLPITPSFLLENKPFRLESLEWPEPKIFTEQDGSITTYGYEGKLSLFFKIPQVPLEDKILTVNVGYLACKNICIPGQKRISGEIKDGKFLTSENEIDISSDDLGRNFNQIPQTKEIPNDFDMVLAKDKEKGLTLYYNLPEIKNISYPRKNIIFPLPSHPFNFKSEQLFKDSKGNIYGKIEIVWDGEYSDTPEPLPVDGNFQKPYTLKFLFLNPLTNKYELIAKTFSSFDINGIGKSDDFFKLLTPIKPAEKKEILQSNQESFWIYLIFAFLGGLLLNLMPCVLPVISLKIFHLIKQRKASKSQLLKHNLSYSMGVFFTLMVLGIIIASLKATGQIIGWGFQLQSPQFITIIILVLFIFSLNLFGLFDFLTPGGKFLGNIKVAENYFGDFLSGILTTILATPCSAPFLGTALTFAFTSSNSNIFLIFGGIALGLSAPFLLTGIFPRLISLFPKPGQWMEGLKHFLGLSLLLTIVWLLDVLIQLNPPSNYVIYLGTALSLIFFAFFASKHTSKNFIFFIILLILPGLILGKILFVNDFSKEEITWIPWSNEKMNELKSSNNLVFLDFTAKWCLTCKVNEAMVLKTEKFKELARKHDLKLLIADWTKRDQNITNFLLENGKVGVPAYFIIDKQGKLIDLGETISVEEINQHLK